MTWKDRISPNAKLISPDGKEYLANWREDSLSITKKTGIFFYPKVNGNVVQDWGVNSDNITTTIYFHGQDYDLDVEAFLKSVRERDLWTVELPNRLPKKLQLLSVKDSNQPITSGGVRAIDLEFIEPIDPKTLKTYTELAALVKTGLNDLNDLSAQQFVDGLQTFPASTIAGIKNAVEKVQAAMDKVLGPINKSNAELYSLNLAIQRGIQDTLDATILDPLLLASQLQQLAEMPADILIDIQSRVKGYVDLAAEIFGLQPTGANTDDRNTAVVNELILVSAIGGSALTCTNAPESDTDKAGYKSRSEALTVGKRLVDNYDSIIDNLDDTQSNFELLDLEDQYVNQALSSFNSAKIVRQSLDFINNVSYDLAIERKIRLPKPMNMIDVVIQEYGGLGDNDQNIELFINSNGLKGDELLFIPAGKELIIYG